MPGEENKPPQARKGKSQRRDQNRQAPVPQQERPQRQSRPPKPTSASPVPFDWSKWLTLRPMDLRAIQGAWTDDVVRRRGIGIYEEMLYDAQVASSLDLLKFAVLSLKRHIKPPGDDGDDQRAGKAVDLIERQLESFPGGFTQFLYEALSCLDYGYSITETKYGPGSDGGWRINHYTSLPPALYGFALDEDTTVKGVTFLGMLGTSGESAETYPLENFFVLRWNARFGSPYGRSQLRRAYEPWWMKSLMRRMRNTTLDRFGSPLTFFKVPKNTPEKDRYELRNILENLYAEAGGVIDDVYNLEVVSGEGASSAQGFQMALDYEDAQIAKGITGVTLNANQSTGAGTYAQSVVHQDNFLYYVENICRMVEDAVNNQLIPRLCDYNLGLAPDECPRFAFEEIRADDMQLLIQALGFAQTAGIAVPHKEFAWMRDKLGMPAADPDVVKEIQQQADLQKQQQQLDMQAQQAQAQGGPDPGSPDPSGSPGGKGGKGGDDQGAAFNAAPASYGGKAADDQSQGGGGDAYDQWWRSYCATTLAGDLP